MEKDKVLQSHAGKGGKVRGFEDERLEKRHDFRKLGAHRPPTSESSRGEAYKGAREPNRRASHLH